MVDRRVLVLNKSWVAVQIASTRRALSLLYQGLARAVHPTDYSLYDFDDWCDLSRFVESGLFVHTVHLRIRVPEVIILKAFNGFVHHEIRFSRRNIFERDKNTCQYCGRRKAKSDLTLDHVIPRSRGGYDAWENLVLACMTCNVRKASRTPEEARMPLIRRPVKPTWLPQLGARVPTSQLISWQRFLDAAYWDVELRE
jgi:5-methylcytosine-specific restriction endonuclease McrA